MKLRRMNLDDYEMVVDMFYDFTVELFEEDRKINPKYFYYKTVMDWINDSKHITLAEDDGVVLGFSLCYIDTFDMLTEPVYNCDYAYVKPEHRKTRAAYMLYHNGSQVAKELGMNLIANGRVANGVDKMMEKHFKLESRYINFERKK